MANATATNVADFIYKEIHYFFSAPKEILLDNGSNLNAEVV
jgi:hypothetical protein